MILQSLVAYYETLAERGEIARPGWASVPISFVLYINDTGTLEQVVSIKTEVQKGKKTVFAPQNMTLPAPAKHFTKRCYPDLIHRLPKRSWRSFLHGNPKKHQSILHFRRRWRRSLQVAIWFSDIRAAIPTQTLRFRLPGITTMTQQVMVRKWSVW